MTFDRCTNGDVVAFQGNGRFSRLVSWFTGSVFTHVAVVVLVRVSAIDDPVPCIVESHSTGGYRLRPLCSLTRPFWLFKTGAKWRQEAAHLAFRYLGTYKYAWLNIALAFFGLRMVTIGGHMVCHQFVARILNKCGVHVGRPQSPKALLEALPNTEAIKITPNGPCFD